jgi:asparagine synthetase B (glutamine-hydrolysing)
MSSILSFSGHINSDKSIWTKDKILKMADKFQTRGDYQEIYQNLEGDTLMYLVHNRLAIVGLETTSFMGKDNLVVAFDGEIINYQNFDDLFKKTGSVFESDTDYEFLLYMYSNLVKVSEEHVVPDEFKFNDTDKTSQNISVEEKLFSKMLIAVADGTKNLLEAFEYMLNSIKGDFAFILHDINRKKSLIIRKGYGLTPLYYGITQSGEFIIASEKKILVDDCIMIKSFPYNSFIYDHIDVNTINQLDIIKPILNMKWLGENSSKTKYSDNQDFKRIVFNQFTNLEKFMSNSISINKLPFGLIFNGSLDSQILLKIVNKTMIKESKWGVHPHVFSIHLKGYSFPNPIKQFLKDSEVIHYTFTYTIEDALKFISKIIYIMESYDMNTILSAIPLYFLLNKINKSFHLKYVYAPIGLDEFRMKDLTNDFKVYSEKYGSLGNKLPSSIEMKINMPFIESGMTVSASVLDNEYWNNVYKGDMEDFHLIREMARQYGIQDKEGETCYRDEINVLKDSLENELNKSGLVSDQEFATGLILYHNNPPKSKLDYYIKKIYTSNFKNF